MMKNRTYRNFLIVFNQIKRKGWNQEEAAEITRNIFNQFEANPEGLSIEAMAKKQCTKAEFEADLLRSWILDSRDTLIREGRNDG